MIWGGEEGEIIFRPLQYFQEKTSPLQTSLQPDSPLFENSDFFCLLTSPDSLFFEEFHGETDVHLNISRTQEFGLTLLRIRNQTIS